MNRLVWLPLPFDFSSLAQPDSLSLNGKRIVMSLSLPFSRTTQ